MNKAQRLRVSGIRGWAFMTPPLGKDWSNGDDIRFLIQIVEEQDGLIQRTAGVLHELEGNRIKFSIAAEESVAS